ncbi:MAG: hypothetical protein U1F43_35935 [Myxococcota bacterium]
MQYVDKKLPGKGKTEIGPNVSEGLKGKAKAFLEQAQKGGIEKPKDEQTPKGGGPTMVERRVSILVNSFGRKVENLVDGILKMNLAKEDGAVEALEKQVGKDLAGKAWFKVRQVMLDKHLHDTGRNDLESEEANEKRETITGKILSGIESSTQENQTMRDKVTKAPKPSPKAHPVSAHGKGSNQVARLVSGHRGDEVDSLKGGKEVTLDGNKNGLGPTSVPDVDTVGSAPSNTTGAFTTNQGMLHVIGEAFAQGNMIESFAQKERREGKTNTMDQERIAPNVQGPGGKIGEGLELPGHYKQKSGVGLSKDEKEQRFKDIKKTGPQENARMVLDPAFNEKGARIGWNLQTAYANNDKPTENFKNVDEVSKSPKAARQRAKQLKLSVEGQTKTVGEIEGKLVALPKNLGFKQKALPGRLKKAEEAEKKVTTLGEGKEKEEAQKAAVIARASYDSLVQEIAQVENVEKPALEKQLQEAKEKLVDLEKELKEAEEVVSKLPEEKPEDGEEGSSVSNDKSPMQGLTGGYDGKTGQWVGGRPGKPQGSDELKGLDEGGKNLTAHHLYPWNKIESDLNSALSSKNVGAMQKILAFAGETVSEDFWKEFKLDPKDRTYAFAEELNRIVPHICWSPSNVFMGPSERGDDPKENVDATFENGLPTHQSALAELLGSSGGLRDVKDKVDDDPMKSPLENSKANREHSKGRLGEMLLRNLRDDGKGGQTEKGHAKPYKQGEWTKDKNGAPIRKQPGVQGRKWEKDEKDKPKLVVPKVVTPPKVDTGKKTTKTTKKTI